MRQMDFFQGSTPHDFIPFCLEKQTTGEITTPANSSVEVPVEALLSSAEPQSQFTQDVSAPRAPHSQQLVEDVVSSHSVDSDLDVTAYAESVVQRIESTQPFAQAPKDDACTTSATI